MAANALSLDLKEEILRLKKEKNAVILAHNYQIGEIQDIADYVGDSLGLAYKAKETAADVIAFCGVHFMAETAKIVNPTKTVILPDKDAGCSLEQACPAEDLAAFLEQHKAKNYYVIAYINCSGGVKALCDVICTSGNAVRIVEQSPADRPILFVPDQNLGSWVMEQTGRKMDLWQGACYVHVEFTRQAIRRIQEEYPGAAVVAHPECTYAVRILADEVCSTEKMIDFCRKGNKKDNIGVTEAGYASPHQKRSAGEKSDSRTDGQLRLCRLPIHEDEHLGEIARLPGKSLTHCRDAGRNPQTRGTPASSDARTE